MPEHSRSFTSELSRLPELRGFFNNICRAAWGVEPDDEALCQIELALQEAATNIIRHAYRGERGQPIDMTVSIDETTVEITLRHNGDDFDPATVQPPSFDGSRFGGFGIYMIQQLVDEVVYDRDAVGRAGVRLVKRRKK